MISSGGPSRKKLKLTVLGLAQRENYDPSMSSANQDTQVKNQTRNWASVRNSKEILRQDKRVFQPLYKRRRYQLGICYRRI